MSKRIAIIGTLDTKGEEIRYIKQRIEEQGHQAIVIDVGVLGEVPFEPTITRYQVAEASGVGLDKIAAFAEESEAMNAMAEGASKVVEELYSSDKLDGAVAIGGSMGTALGLTVMKVLPIGVPKLILSTIAFTPLITSEVVSGDLMMLHWVAGFWGINDISRRVLDVAAGAISGSAKLYSRQKINEKPIVGITSLGMVACKYLYWLKPALEQKGYEVAVFYVSGTGGRVFEQAIAEGSICAALDLATIELGDQVCGGICSAGAHRLEAAGKKGIPQIIAPGCIDWFRWETPKPLPRKFANRTKRVHNPLVSVINTLPKEKATIAKLIADKLNQATGPAAVVVPMGGFSELDKPGGFSYDPRGREAFRRVLKANLKPEVKMVELDANINDPSFADSVMSLLDEMMQMRQAT